jgi:hypothetical protein
MVLNEKICIASATSKGKEQQGRAGPHLCGRGVGACRLGGYGGLAARAWATANWAAVQGCRRTLHARMPDVHLHQAGLKVGARKGRRVV